MTKNDKTKKKLTLERSTVRQLTEAELRAADGGMLKRTETACIPSACFYCG